MNFTNLYKYQENLRERITEKHGVIEERLKKLILALDVEVSELANETRCFKFWSNKGPAPKKRILEEYVDCIHFMLDLGLEINKRFKRENSIVTDADITTQFLLIYKLIDDFRSNPRGIYEYQTLFQAILGLGFLLEFTEDEIEQAYYEKNKINHVRQDNNY